jgi:Cadherin-like beta sandwich domain
MAKIKRSLVKTFLNTGSIVSPTWSLISAGVPTGTINMNPKTNEETYIGDDLATITVESYAPTMPIESSAVAADEAFEWLDEVRKSRNLLGDAETEVVNVWLYETTALGYYYAEKQDVSIQVDAYGGDAGVPLKLNYTINYLGDAVSGGFNPTTLDFEPLAITTKLTTMVIGSVTLTPLFATDKAWLWYAGSVSNATTTVTMTSTLSGATIVQKDDGGTTVAQGDPASLSVGVNNLTIEVTVGAESVTYRIDITRAAS